MSQTNQKHTPVLLKAVLDCLKPQEGESYLDVTAGYGGHAQAVLAQTRQPNEAVLIERDREATAVLADRFAAAGAQIVHQDFLSASAELARQDRQFDMILADLGVSSPHLESASRGFSFARSGPLDMRMDLRQELSAEDLVNQSSEAELNRILAEYGEEPKARQIARMIVQARPIKTTDQLAKIAARAWPRGSRVHPATRAFQALRIAVNDELNQLEQSLPLWLDLLAPGGRLAVISFHSLEDRIVKNFLAEHSTSTYEGELKILTKKPLTAAKDEIVSNPRARSAKLRAAVKIKTIERI
ncbi:MAG TPA: 16S rRNA (cytosine(1402)-N(4))-methyltransferase RsmH [Candidatus Saccharimonadales bacterium]|nr:16S rRNA (cytosine(1402)-N(4))-methyltransferase RsmH [Candidatus Saccharimonadales bacterium]